MAGPLTLGLQNLRRQVDAEYPNRDRSSDGSVGDAAHKARTSGHNYDDTPGSRPAWNGDADQLPEVRAWDCDADLGPGVDAQDLVDHIRRLPGLSSVIRYIIFDGWWYHVRDGFGRAPYSGDNKHRGHIHFEGAWTDASDRNTTFNYRLQEVPVALTEADKKWLAAEIDKAATKAAERTWATQITDYADPSTPKRKLPAGVWLGYSDHRHRTTETRVAEAIQDAADRPS